MLKLGIFSDRGNASRACKQLRLSKKPLIDTIPYLKGEELIYYLTSKGKDFLIDHAEMNEREILFSPNKVYRKTQDTTHRLITIDLQIAIEMGIDNSPMVFEKCDRYFDPIGADGQSIRFKSKTAFTYAPSKSVKADIIFALRNNQEWLLYVVEVERGYNVAKAVEKLHNHAQAIFLESVNKKYDYHKAYLTLCIFEQTSTMHSTIKRLNKQPIFEHLKEHFLFTDVQQAIQNFYGSWNNLEGEERKLWYKDFETKKS